MLRVRIQHARVGMQLAMPVAHPRQAEVILLRQGVTLDAFNIPRLHELGIEDIWVQYPGLEHLAAFVDPELQHRYRELVRNVGHVMDRAMVASTGAVEVDFNECRRMVVGMIARLSGHPQTAVWASQLACAEAPFVRHAGNVCALSVLMGMRLDWYMVRERPLLPPNRAKELSSLGVGALFHDLGMLRLPHADIARWNNEHDESCPVWRSHAAIGFEMVKGMLDPAAASVVLHHHQAWDGSGFPHRASLKEGTRPVRERETHVLARIAAAADLLDRLCNPAHAPGSDPVRTPQVPVVRALKTIARGGYAPKLDPIVFRALFSIAPPYPPGSLVRLSDGNHAAVVDWTPQDPCRPTVEVLDLDNVRPTKKRNKPVRLDLREHKKLHVVEHDAYDVSGDNFYPTTPEEFDLAGLMHSMTNRARGDLAAQAGAGHLEEATAAPEPVAAAAGAPAEAAWPEAA